MKPSEQQCESISLKEEISRLRQLLLVAHEHVRQAEHRAWQAEQDLATFEGDGWRVINEMSNMSSRHCGRHSTSPCGNSSQVDWSGEGQDDSRCVRGVRPIHVDFRHHSRVLEGGDAE